MVLELVLVIEERKDRRMIGTIAWISIDRLKPLGGEHGRRSVRNGRYVHPRERHGLLGLRVRRAEGTMINHYDSRRHMVCFERYKDDMRDRGENSERGETGVLV